MLRCNDCGEIFYEEDTDTIRTTYEAYYGVSSEFIGSTPMFIDVCPYCKSEALEEFLEEEDEEYEVSD